MLSKGKSLKVVQLNLDDLSKSACIRLNKFPNYLRKVLLCPVKNEVFLSYSKGRKDKILSVIVRLNDFELLSGDYAFKQCEIKFFNNDEPLEDPRLFRESKIAFKMPEPSNEEAADLNNTAVDGMYKVCSIEYD